MKIFILHISYLIIYYKKYMYIEAKKCVMFVRYIFAKRDFQISNNEEILRSVILHSSD